MSPFARQMEKPTAIFTAQRTDGGGGQNRTRRLREAGTPLHDYSARNEAGMSTPAFRHVPTVPQSLIAVLAWL